MKKLYDAANAVEAHMLADLLRQQGIDSRIDGEYLQGAAGGLPAMGMVSLMTDEADHDRARAVLDRWNAQQPAEPRAAPVPSSSSARWRYLAAGLALGVAGTWAWFRTPVHENGIDYNRDGVLDEKWTYAASGLMLKAEVDRNLDGKVDLVIHYDERGLVESSESDDNFDGIFETRTHYRLGNLQTSTSDTDGDGFADARWNYSAGVLTTIDYLDASTGTALRTEYYKLGKITHADTRASKDGQMNRRTTYNALGEAVETRDITP